MRHNEHVLFGDMVVAHSLLEELGSRRTSTFLVLLETPELELAPQDRAALSDFIDRLAEQFGPEHAAVKQLQEVAPAKVDCPDQ